ncbi:hypothetical protein CMUS01_09964 [Colletotrichum musicola]|uniref:Uncharacterized protein n=1 Tax=Colletotrichum musicola TaxID=2175873 RepID=A0A8H6K5Y1_9PEZI|nr:hypothetical protein CMUS01_09964 [Colletotrichum musicola]
MPLLILDSPLYQSTHSSWQHSPPQAACQVNDAKELTPPPTPALLPRVLSANAIPPPRPRNPRPKRRSSTPSGTIPPHPAQQQEEEPTFAGPEGTQRESNAVRGGGSCLGRSL